MTMRMQGSRAAGLLMMATVLALAGVVGCGSGVTELSGDGSGYSAVQAVPMGDSTAFVAIDRDGSVDLWMQGDQWRSRASFYANGFGRVDRVSIGESLERPSVAYCAALRQIVVLAPTQGAVWSIPLDQDAGIGPPTRTMLEGDLRRLSPFTGTRCVAYGMVGAMLTFSASEPPMVEPFEINLPVMPPNGGALVGESDIWFVNWFGNSGRFVRPTGEPIRDDLEVPTFVVDRIQHGDRLVVVSRVGNINEDLATITEVNTAEAGYPAEQTAVPTTDQYVYAAFTATGRLILVEGNGTIQARHGDENAFGPVAELGTHVRAVTIHNETVIAIDSVGRILVLELDLAD